MATANRWAGFRVGLTGGIASGKSFVAGMFAELGVPVIDTDVIAREIVAPGSPLLAEISGQFGLQVVSDAGVLDRRRLRDIVFADPEARKRLDALLHPRVIARTEELAAASGGPYQLLVVPLLVESGFAARVDRVLVVDCPESVQAARLAARDHESDEGIERALAAQCSRDERLAQADDVIDNSGDAGRTRRQVRELHARYLQLAGSHHST
jgi:dephospho-CoA kinase